MYQDFRGVKIKTGDMLVLRPVMRSRSIVYRDLEKGRGMPMIDKLCMVIAFHVDPTFHKYAYVINPSSQMGWVFLDNYNKVC